MCSSIFFLKLTFFPCKKHIFKCKSVNFPVITSVHYVFTFYFYECFRFSFLYDQVQPDTHNCSQCWLKTEQWCSKEMKVADALEIKSLTYTQSDISEKIMSLSHLTCPLVTVWCQSRTGRVQQTLQPLPQQLHHGLHHPCAQPLRVDPGIGQIIDKCSFHMEMVTMGAAHLPSSPNFAPHSLDTPRTELEFHDVTQASTAG